MALKMTTLTNWKYFYLKIAQDLAITRTLQVFKWIERRTRQQVINV